MQISRQDPCAVEITSQSSKPHARPQLGGGGGAAPRHQSQGSALGEVTYARRGCAGCM